MLDEISHTDNLSIKFCDLKASLPLFPTKKKALTAGQEYGWNSAFRLVDRFETVWVVGKRDFEDDFTAGVRRYNYRLPMLRWEKNHYGVKHCPVVQIKKVVNKQ